MKEHQNKPDYMTILEEKLARRGWSVIGGLLAADVLMLVTTVIVLVYNDLLEGLVFGRGVSVMEIGGNIISIVFLVQFLFLLMRVAKGKRTG